jgi:hypothetical protein
VSADACGRIRGELDTVDLRDDAVTEINSPPSARRPVSEGGMISSSPRTFEDIVQQFANRLRAWLRERSEDEKRAAMVAAMGAAAMWVVARPRGRRQSVLGILRTSVVQSFRVAFGFS